jgi:hypothetical protein
LIEAAARGAPQIQGRLRFLQLRARAAAPWDEGELREIDFELAPIDEEQVVPFHLGGGGDGTSPLSGVVRIGLQPVADIPSLLELRVRVENVTAWMEAGAPRNEALRAALLGTHLLLAVSNGAFVSLMDPPAFAAAAAAGCRNVGTYPVLAGPAGRRDLVLSAPVILYDHPAVAPESPRDLFDATEIDEILTLRIQTLTDDEKREVRASDPRLAALLDSADRMDAEAMARLHGATRELRPVGVAEEPPAPRQIRVGAVAVGPGSRVRLRPGARRTDAQDMVRAGLTATVEAVFRDVDDNDCVAVTVDGDPAAELLRWHRRFLYFHPDEIEPLDAPAAERQAEGDR